MEELAVALALVYLVLAIRENRWCWPAGIGSALLYLVVFQRAGLYMQAALQVFYAGMGAYGWWSWRPAAAGPGLAIHRWPLARHGLAIGGVVALGLVTGYALARSGSGAAAPYVDSLLTWGAILTTWMVARKLLENWLYWFVIDAVSLALMLQQGLYPTAGLFAVYLVLVVLGWREWFRTWRLSR